MEENVEQVSIVTPVYRLENYISETLESVAAQTYKDWEWILVEDAGGDRSAELIRQFQTAHPELKIILICREKNEGAAAARNLGVENSRGRYLAFLDGDDLWEPDKLERQMSFLRETGAAFSCTGYEFADEDGTGTGKVVHVPSKLGYRQALGNTTIFTSTVMFDTEKIPRDRIRMPQVKSEDTALWWSILKEGYEVYGLDENLVKYRRPVRSLSSNKLEAVRRIWNLYRKQEGLGIPASIYYFCQWAIRAVLRRV